MQPSLVFSFEQTGISCPLKLHSVASLVHNRTIPFGISMCGCGRSGGRLVMTAANDSKSGQDSTKAAEHVASAREILKTLQEKLGEHPELGAAITRLEMALNDLAIQTGGML